jgi:copper ion binding protein
MTDTYQVSGMTCGHCVAAVTTAITELPGVTAVEVDLDSGRVAITSTDPPAADAVRAAVHEAGYELVS